MDWSKAKNILIVAFIITNIFLIYTVEKDVYSREELELISDEYIKNVEEYLTQKGVELDIAIPREIMSLHSLMVKYKIWDGIEMAEVFLGNNYEVINNNVYSFEEKELTILSNKKLVYRNFASDTVKYAKDEEEAIKISNKFLKQHHLKGKELQLQQIYFGVVEDFGTQPIYKLVYNQVYENRFLGESYIHTYVRHKEVVGVETMLLEYEKTYGQKKKLIPATEALLRKMSDIIQDNRDDEVVISEMEVGYYFDLSNTNFTTWHTIESGTAFPSWKIVLKNGKTYYVEALKN
ncbi:MAG: two-component system regulatory protein YycI [Clostridiaceae bacterium]|nr:two-component system regulatory protein YycI [Clostridiaceae bacterium]